MTDRDQNTSTDRGHDEREVEPRKKRGSPGPWLKGLFDHAAETGREALSVAAGRLFESKRKPEEEEAVAESGSAPEVEAEPQSKPSWRVRMLHNATEQLRGAADSYIAAKLDEIEARVDEKLDAIEHRLDHKLLDVHRQLEAARDRELKHRLRLLKLTLIFTTLVAALSLGYKWLSHWLADSS